MVNLDESIEKEIKSIIDKYQKREVKHCSIMIKNPKRIRTIRIKPIKKFRYLSISSTATLIQNLFSK